ncbi:hypothetical protein TL16_g08097 [Triparma laevis f. inornata]|uniref:Protein kinase domain-containing protein n=1 Tax=Triparma laevis f. inornata TaxID=1714386 RepID=A0A9W7B2F7_9STRA|nr:hypothetical protein TL16_g08097 [Triparma laevis f. inornata]
MLLSFFLIALYPLKSAATTINVASMHIYTDDKKDVGERTRGTSPLERQASVAWGAHTFNNRDSSLVAEFTSAPYMYGCDVQLNTTFFDIGNTQEGAIEAYRDAFLFADRPTDVIIADIYSSRTKTVSFLGKLDVVPVTSGSSTSDELDLIESYPYMTRTIPPDSAVSFAAVQFLKDSGFNKIGVIYVNDPYGIAFKNGVVAAGADEGIEVISAPFEYQSSSDDSAIKALDSIIEATDGQVNAWIGVLFETDLVKVMSAAHDKNAAGGDNVWVFTDGVEIEEINNKGVGASEYVDDDLVDALRGTFRVVCSGGVRTEADDTLFDTYSTQFAALDSDITFISNLEKKALQYTSDGSGMWGDGSAILDNTDLGDYPSDFFSTAALSVYEPFYFDTAIQVGMGACKAIHDGNDPVADGAALHAGMASVSFTGWSGSVIFDSGTGSRTPASTNFVVQNTKYDASDGSLTMVSVGTWSLFGGFDWDCYGCAALEFQDGGSSPPAQRNAIIVDDAAKGVSMDIVFIALGVIVVGLAGFYFWHRKEELELKGQIVKLKEELTLLKAYGEEEQQMIGDEIMTFRENFKKHRDQNKDTSGADGENKIEREARELDKFLIPASDVVPEKQIGKGSFGEVFLANHHGQQVAVKTMNTIDAENLSRFRDEIILMSDLRHPNVVFMVGACWEKQLMALVLEFCQLGTASDNLKPECSWDDPLYKWAKDVAAGIGYLHSVSFFDVKNQVQVHNIIHRDIKPDNCLVTDTFGVKVSDFGEARMAETDKTMTMVGTPFYVAPEVVKGDHYSTSADVYSYAMTLLCFAIRGEKSLNEWLKSAYIKTKINRKTNTVSDNRVAHVMVNKGWRPLNIVEDLGTPTSIANLISICWHDDPSERPDFKEISEYLMTDCMNEIMGATGTGNRRRTSTTGMRVQRRILNAQQERETKLNKEKEEELKAAVKNTLVGGGISQEVGAALTNLVGLFEKDSKGNIDDEDVKKATKLVECMKLGYPREGEAEGGMKGGRRACWLLLTS